MRHNGAALMKSGKDSLKRLTWGEFVRQMEKAGVKPETEIVRR